MAIIFCAATLFAQTATVTRNVNLRSDLSSEYPPIRLLTPSEPPLILIDAMPESGYYHVKTAAGEDGYVWSRNVRVAAAPSAAATTIQPGPGLPGSDQAASEYERQALVHKAASARQVLKNLTQALQRMRQGSFGECAECGGDIELKRLEAIPWARYCVTCQEARERG